VVNAENGLPKEKPAHLQEDLSNRQQPEDLELQVIWLQMSDKRLSCIKVVLVVAKFIFSLSL